MATINPNEILSIDVILKAREQWKPDEILIIEKAIKFATKKHASQTRFDGTPYVNHTISTGKK